MATTAKDSAVEAAVSVRETLPPRKVNNSAIAGALGFIGVAVLGGRVLWRSVPFDLASYSAWAGILLALAALVSLIRVPRWVGLRNRKQVGIVFCLGVALATAAVLWPTPSLVTSSSRHRINDFLPRFQVAEYHEVRTRASMDRIVEAMHYVTLADMPGASALLRIRALAAGKLEASEPVTEPLLDSMVKPGSGFMVLDVSSPQELVYGMVGCPWTNEPPPTLSTPEEFVTYSGSGQVRIAFDFRVEPEDGGWFKVSTETRILGNDANAQKLFARYWTLIYPGSAIIRRLMLDAVVARAERPVP